MLSSEAAAHLSCRTGDHLALILGTELAQINPPERGSSAHQAGLLWSSC
jgi:hypothetical protein